MVDRALWLIHGFGASSQSFARLFATPLASRFRLIAPDWPQLRTIDSLADWLAQTIDRAPRSPCGIVGHSIGAVIATRAVSKLSSQPVGLFSIEGNLTREDAYLTGQVRECRDPISFRERLLEAAEKLAKESSGAQAEAWRDYAASVAAADVELLWNVARDVVEQSVDDRFGQELRSLPIPHVYYSSPTGMTDYTRNYISRTRIRNISYAGGHWPMLENPAETASKIREFFEPLFASSAASQEE